MLRTDSIRTTQPALNAGIYTYDRLFFHGVMTPPTQVHRARFLTFVEGHWRKLHCPLWILALLEWYEELRTEARNALLGGAPKTTMPRLPHAPAAICSGAWLHARQAILVQCTAAASAVPACKPPMPEHKPRPVTLISSN